MVHLDVKKGRRHPRRRRPGLQHPPTAIDGFSRLAYTEALPDETARTTIGFTHRARAFLDRHGIRHAHRIVTCYRARDFATVLHGARHQRTTPRHNGKAERYHRILADETTRTWISE